MQISSLYYRKRGDMRIMIYDINIKKLDDKAIIPTYG